jgi:dipeptidyl aminopeptidase/acylaminoacyl peptidase
MFLMRTRHLASVFLLFATLSPAVAQTSPQRPLIPRAVLFGFPEHTAPNLSPKGLQIAYERPADGNMEVWVQTLGSHDDHAVTHAKPDEKGNVTSFFWHADGHHIFYQRDPLGNATVRLHLQDLDTGDSRDLTPYEWVGLYVVAYNPQHPDTLLIAMNKRDGHHFDVYRVNAKSGETVLDTEAPDTLSWMGWFVSPDLVVRGMALDLPDGGSTLQIRSDAHSPWRELLRCGPEDMAGILSWQDENQKVNVLTTLGSDTMHLEEIDVATGKRSVLLAANPNAELGGVWSNPKTGVVDLIQYQGDRRTMVALDKSREPDLRALRSARAGEIDLIVRIPDTPRWIVTYRTNAATWWYWYDPATKKATPIYSDQPAFEKYHLAEKQPFTLHARDGMLLHGYLTRPVDAKKNQRLPMVVLVHGGPERRDELSFDPWAMWLADRGYLVLQLNFRGSEGYGKSYQAAGYHEWAGKMRTDLLDAKAWVVQHAYADPRRVCIMGGSYGGYATLAGLVFSPKEYTCGVALAAPSDLALMVQQHPNDNDFIRELGKDIPELEAISPDRFADRVEVPVLIAQGGSDMNVRPEQAERMVAALRANHKEVEYFVFPEERHGLENVENSFAFHAAVERFLARFLGGRVEHPTPAESQSLAQSSR